MNIILTLLFVNDFNVSNTNKLSQVLLPSNEIDNTIKKANKSFFNMSNESPLSFSREQEKFSNSDNHLKRYTEYDAESNDRSSDRYKKDSEDQLEKYKKIDEIQENEIKEIQDIFVLESMEIMRKGKKSRVQIFFTL